MPTDRRPGASCRPRAGAAVLALALCAPATAAAEIVVRAPGAEGARIGIETGDVLVAWRDPREPASASRRFASWADPQALDRLEIPRRGALEIEILRGEVRHVIRTRPLPIELAVAPRLPPELEAKIERVVGGETPAGDEAVAGLRALTEPAGAEAVTWALAELAEAASKRGDFETAQRSFLAAAETAPPALAAELTHRAGNAFARAGRLDEAEAAHRDALARWQRLEPEGLGASFAISALGSLEARRHDFAESRQLTERSLAIRRRLAPGSYLVASALNNLGTLAGRRNDLATAESRLVEALGIYRELGGMTAATLANLGIVARLRGELDRAERYTLEAIAELERQGDLADAARKRSNLANIVAEQGDHRRALAIYDRLFEVDYKVTHERRYLPDAYLNRALVHRLLGDLAGAEADLRRAREALEPEHRDTMVAASIVQAFAENALDRGDLERASSTCAEALEAQARLRPDTSFEARAASVCARIAARREDWPRADELFARSLAAFEIQQRRVGGGERGLVAFRQKHRDLYRHYVDYLVARGRAEAAFEVNERYRAQALRALLAQRDLELEARAPQPLRTERERLGAEIERAYSRLAKLPSDSADAPPLRIEIERLHRARDEVGTRIRSHSKALAAAEAPPALSIAALASGLPAGTVALVYDIGETAGRLFVLGPDARVEIHDLGIDPRALAGDVERWAELAARPRAGAELRALSASLSETLLGPAAPRIEGATRLLVVPDGSLHALSFAALPSPSGGRPSRYLVERLSLVRDVSVSVFVAGLDARERRPVKPEVVVFGDPGPSTAATSRFRGEYGSLPASRREAESVGSLFADRARLFVGPAATEEAARAHLPQAGVAHFACHAAVDELLPLDSALVLAPDDSGGGLLQAWEIAEELRLDGALVVLSACETAKGGERAGEGIVGLVRALQVAGAESIVASLWRISDESTAELMRRFYGYLDRGVDRDEALRRAQLELLRGPIEVERDGERVRIDASSPRHWAPFVLLGAHAGRALP